MSEWRDLNPEPALEADEAITDLVEDHVAEIMFDSQSRPDPDCELCKEASRRRIWQDAYGEDDPLEDPT